MKKSFLCFIYSFTFLLIISTQLSYSIEEKKSTDVRCGIIAAKESAYTELATPFAKVGLESLISRFHYARVKFKQSSYRTNELKATFQETFNAFRRILWEEDLDKVLGSISDKEIRMMEKSYDIYRKDFDSFVQRITTQYGPFQYISPNLIHRSRVYYALILLGGDKDQWIMARKFTNIWPFCE